MEHLTPKEKAHQLKNRFGSLATNVVDEIIESWKLDGNPRLDKGIFHYWNRVKEILITTL